MLIRQHGIRNKEQSKLEGGVTRTERAHAINADNNQIINFLN